MDDRLRPNVRPSARPSCRRRQSPISTRSSSLLIGVFVAPTADDRARAGGTSVQRSVTSEIDVDRALLDRDRIQDELPVAVTAQRPAGVKIELPPVPWTLQNPVI